MTRRIIRATLLASLFSVTACVPVRWSEPEPEAPPTQAEQPPAVNVEPRSRRGNPAFYEVYGVRYTVMDDARGFSERGVASWYGKKFHGKLTSNGEKYDMYAMTAAHKTLPLPSTVRVTNLENGKQIIVRVNDRGPFIDNRIIDLSYAAAHEIDMVRDGTVLVEMEVLSTPAGVSTGTATVPGSTAGQDLYLQVGAYGDLDNAYAMLQRLNAGGITNTVIHSDSKRKPPLHRVRIGPVDDVSRYDELVQRTRELGILETQLITKPRQQTSALNEG